jgi:hypothetical protein
MNKPFMYIGGEKIDSTGPMQIPSGTDDGSFTKGR